MALVLGCAACEEVSKLDAKTANLSGFFSWVIILIGFVYLGNFLARALSDLDNFLSRDTAEDFIAPLLTITLIPLLYLVSWFSRRQGSSGYSARPLGSR